MGQIFRVQTSAPYYSFTFDDGPDPVLTPLILASLRQHGAQATFFVIGEKVLRYPDLVRAIVGEGHEIGNHTYTHRYLLKQYDSEILKEIIRTQHLVFDACGVEPTLFRPPHGRLTDHQLAMLMNSRAPRPCYWSVDAKDWRDQDSALLASRIIAAVSAGDIVLAHDTIEASVTGSAAAIVTLRERGLFSVSVSELLRHGSIMLQPRSQTRLDSTREEQVAMALPAAG